MASQREIAIRYIVNRQIGHAFKQRDLSCRMAWAYFLERNLNARAFQNNKPPRTEAWRLIVNRGRSARLATTWSCGSKRDRNNTTSFFSDVERASPLVQRH